MGDWGRGKAKAKGGWEREKEAKAKGGWEREKEAKVKGDWGKGRGKEAREKG